jgi:DNA polymerase-3 subunit delta'
MKEAANALLKVLEEPPEFATIFLLTENSGELLPTIRSRSMTVSLGALPITELERYLAEHRSDWNSSQRALVARLAEGALGRALSFDLQAYTAARGHALTILNSALRNSEHTELFKMTETYRAGAEGREKTEKLLRLLYSLLQDITFINSGTPELLRNRDIQGELAKLAELASFEWIATASERLAEVERGMRRNVLRNLSLDAFATALERG